MSDDKDYSPIDCATYSQFELHIMHQDKLKLCWNDVTQLTHIDIIRPYDLRTASDGEYMHAYDSQGTVIHIRLDRIIEFSRVS